MSWKLTPSCLLVLSIAFASALLSAVAQTYTITDLGLGIANSQATAINNYGQVVGTGLNGEQYTTKHCHYELCWFCNPRWVCIDVSYDKQRAFLWTPTIPNGTTGTVADLGTWGGPNASVAALNQSGQVIGSSDTRHLQTYGGKDVGYSDQYYSTASFLWTPSQPNTASGSMSDQGVPTSAINSLTQIVGGSSLWQNGSLTDLGSLGGGATQAHGINDLGQVVGGSRITTNGPYHAFLWQKSVMTDLGTLPDTDSVAMSINTNGQVVGFSYRADGAAHPFLFTLDSSGMVTSRTDLGILGIPPSGGGFGEALAVNNAGQVVGYSSTSSGENRAFLWDRAHGLRDLSTLLVPGSGWYLASAQGINDHGQVAAVGIHPELGGRAVLLTPPPAPRLTVAAVQPSGHFRFTLLGAAGQSYTIQASASLVNWIVVTNFVSATGTNQFTDATASSFKGRFYRAVSP